MAKTPKAPTHMSGLGLRRKGLETSRSPLLGGISFSSNPVVVSTSSGGDSFTADPLITLSPIFIDTTAANDSGAVGLRTFGGSGYTAPIYKTLAAGMAAANSSNKRVCIFGGQTHLLSADLVFSASGCALQGDPSAAANNMPKIDLNGGFGIKPDKNGTRTDIRIRKVEITGQNKTPTDGNDAPGPIYLGSGGTYNSFIAEFLYIHDNWVDSGNYDTGCITFGPATLSTGPIVRYCKFKNYGIPPSNFTNGNVVGVYVGGISGAQIYNCEMDNTSTGGFHKHGAASPSPNGSKWLRNIVKNCYVGLQFENAGISGPHPLFSCVVSNNLLYNINQNAIYPQQIDGGLQCDDFLISNNTIDGSTIAIFPQGFTNIVCRNNAVINSSLAHLGLNVASGISTQMPSCNFNRWGTGGSWWVRSSPSRVTYSSLATWRTAFSAGSGSPQLTADPDAAFSTTITSAVFNNAAARQYWPAAGSALLGAGSDGKNIGCYDGVDLASSTLIGAGW